METKNEVNSRSQKELFPFTRNALGNFNVHTTHEQNGNFTRRRQWQKRWRNSNEGFNMPSSTITYANQRFLSNCKTWHVEWKASSLKGFNCSWCVQNALILVVRLPTECEGAFVSFSDRLLLKDVLGGRVNVMSSLVRYLKDIFFFRLYLLDNLFSKLEINWKNFF